MDAAAGLSSPGLSARYGEDGIVFPVRVMPERQARAAAERYPALQRFVCKELGLRNVFKTHLLATWVDELVRLPSILDAVEGVIGPDILCWTSGFFAKEPYSTSYVGWHQDATYWGLEPVDGIVTAWLALTPSTAANGCMRAMPGTQRRGQLAHLEGRGESNLLSQGQCVGAELDVAAAVDVVLAPGEISLHGAWLIHGSGPNPSDTPRIGLSIQYVSTEVGPVCGEDSALLVRGVDRYGHFLKERSPAADFSADAVAAYRSRLHMASVCGRAQRARSASPS
ncbi:MAG: phytanoyl-CoA dioxygenase family protein [Gammaproteobacteria bacterium]|nr:phytanoyl-CoA dioxygenase family protein [Gammaproteobacteria bacterium]NIR58729.1 phytanoyl-CoA dioxygenase family protein [Gammaproteobacteria bacterium]NIR88583.1 phytanoyl-CoA dioxygenase family protein [Gammaproteobacteria bacterium]